MPSEPVPRDHSLRDITVAPVIWAAHFLLCYVVAAVYCAKTATPADLGFVRLWIAGVTVLALGGIAATALRALRRGHFMVAWTAPHDADTLTDRRRFLAYATLLLSGLSFVATFYVALPALFIASCR